MIGTVLTLQGDPPAGCVTLGLGLKLSPKGSHDAVSSCRGIRLVDIGAASPT